jgi:hypothetical protein
MLAERLGAWRDIDLLDYGSGSGTFAAHSHARLRRHHQLRSVLQPRAAGQKIQPYHMLRGDRV